MQKALGWMNVSLNALCSTLCEMYELTYEQSIRLIGSVQRPGWTGGKKKRTWYNMRWAGPLHSIRRGEANGQKEPGRVNTLEN
jgi:hypothetical protein